ncbi:MAG: AIPR protein [Bradyrhizobiaceae bacterium]|nr:MAG: AIPR protein [Bradyrhizobiaceae bacterium]
MDLITSSLLSDFTKEFQLDDLPESERFEHFTAYVTVRRHYSEIFDTSDITVGEGNDLGIDAIATIVNGVLIADTDGLDDLMSGNPDYLDVSFIFVQADRGTSFEAAKLGNFAYGVSEFFNPSTKEPRNEYVKAAADVMAAIFAKSAKFKRGNPTCRLYYATTGKWSGEGALEARRLAATKDLTNLEYFSEVDIVPVGASELQKFYNQTKNSISREFVFANRQDVPEIPGVKEAFVGFVPAKQFLPIISEAGEIIRSIFYDNVRDFQGYNGVNDEIRQTLKSDRKSRFVLMNNGITIIARSVTHTASRFVIEDFQIVNGCQTSHVLFDNQDQLDDSVMVPLRLISTQDEEVIEDIIHATNKQTEIDSGQFFAISEFARQLEMHFKSFDDVEARLYYERRSRQYDRLNIEKTRIVPQTSAIRAFAAMFLNEPHNTVRSYKALAERVGKDIFVQGHKILPYYTAAFTLYLLEYLFRNQKVESSMKVARYQILLASRILANKNPVPQLNSRQMDAYCKGICEKLWAGGTTSGDILFGAVEAVKAVAGKKFDRDPIHTAAFTEELIAYCQTHPL